jgi:hypothetical protein
MARVAAQHLHTQRRDLKPRTPQVSLIRRAIDQFLLLQRRQDPGQRLRLQPFRAGPLPADIGPMR